MYSILISLSILVIPWLLVRFIFYTPHTRALSYTTGAAYVWVAAILWLVAFMVPNIPISSETTTFGQHFIGGIIAAILFAYTVKVYDLHFTYWWQPVVGLYFFASGLGVANELFELALTRTGFLWIDSSDVWWDLLANTCGAFAALAGWTGLRAIRRKIRIMLQ